MQTLKTASQPLFQIEALRKMEKNGFSPAVLLAMQTTTMREAMRIRMVTGMSPGNNDELASMADRLLPQGESLVQFYNETKTGMQEFARQDLQRVATAIEDGAASLEFSSAKQLANESREVGGPTQGEIAWAHGQIANRYATLIDAAKELEEMGVASVHRGGTLESISERPTGPLEPFYDKAVIILEARKESQYSGLRQVRYG